MNSLRAGHTQMYTNVMDKSNFMKPDTHRRLAYNWYKKFFVGKLVCSWPYWPYR